ncbi:MAG: DUF6531 domain-containing protein, partial [Clostridiales bacterium]|nr:DUF6531 domain-containing protein [Clostridiales bacterium]
MNNVLTYIQVRVDCPYPIQYLTDLKITSQFNEHSQISVKGILLEEDRDKCVKTSTVNDPIRIYETNENGNDTLLFSGVVTSLNVRCESGVYYVEIKGLSYTYLMDRAFMSRSFQDINALYTEVMNQIISAYDNANFIQIPQDHHIGGLIVQYNETDWMFARRLASHFNTVLVPQDLGNGPCFWIGLHQSSEKEIEAAPNFITRNDSEAYRLIYSYGFNVRESDFMKYEIESETRLMLGDRVVFQGWPCIVERTVASFVDGLFQYKYVLGRDNGSLQPKRLNEKLRGVSLLGSVLDSQNSAVKIHLRIDDNQNTQTACWIPYAAQSNNLFYCMPEKGENISLYFQNSDESSSIAINAVRRNGGNCSKTSRPSTKYMGIPSGQEFKLGDMDINFNASDSLFFKINNDTGVQIQSPTDLTILAGQKLSFEAQGMFKVLSRSGNVLVGVGARADQSQFYFEGSAGGNANIFSSANIINDGRFKEVLTDRLNAPIEYEEKKFNFWEALGWALLAVAAVALVVFSAGTALVAMGVLATCAFPAFLATGIGLAACFAAAQMVDDYWNGETSGFLDYLKAAAQGAELGAMIVCPILALPGLAEDLDEQIQANGFWGGLKGFASEMVDGIVGFGHAWQNQITNIHDWIAYDKKFNPSDLIRLTGTTVAIIYNVCRAKDPVDVVTGAMFYTATDFEFPGPIPFTWSRTYYSDSRLVGQMGHGMRHCFEMGLDVYEEEKTLVVYLSDGRQVQFPYLQVAGNEYFSHENKILLRREIDHYALFDPKTRLMYRLELIPGGLISYKLTDISNEQGYHIQFSYDNRGHLSDIIDSVGRKMTVITNDSGQITSVLWANNLLVQYHYNEQLDLTEATDAAGKTSKMFYRDHLMVRKTDKNGGSFRWNYDYGYNVPYGRVCETFGEDGTLKGKFVYHDDKNFTEVIDALGITKYYYDERNLCTRIVYPDLTETRRVYDEQFNLVCKIDENGYPTTYTYNEWSRLL